MKKMIFAAIALLGSVNANAQRAETIYSFVAVNHEAEWYAEQAEAWEKEVAKDSRNEWAWRNLFRATHYHTMHSNGYAAEPDKSATAEVLKRMEEAIPDSYTLNMCKQRFCLSDDSLTLTGKTLLRAIELMPENADAGDVEHLGCRLWANDPGNVDVGRLMRLAYKKNSVPEAIMRYNWNMLMSMERDALYFGSGDNVLIPMRELQDALGVRTDVTVVPMSYLFVDSYREYVCRKLNIEPFAESREYDKTHEDWRKQYLTDVITHIIGKSGREAYFFTDATRYATLREECLYNEGLLMRYSEKPYNNFDVAIRNVREVYHLEYLGEPAMTYSVWDSCDRMNMNYVTLLGHLVKKMRQKGEKEAAERLYETLRKTIEMSTTTEDSKVWYREYLREQSGVER